ncbi:hypothetical protein N5079_23550 [Planotetraspora sp. A-T 1434]|uniref:hypothetical protein n=1 Tax=Planotetraspora sp. A-T 1434 TaxID=2979219 RepID=UPI0021C0B2DC|nr:hypothetical protein [Planotetraspora sp. A-T 1434]MCT9933190.1 hypothetical protein [Planotetraspora sp. A-T 1434]
MRFPSRLLAANMLFALMIWAGYFVVVTAITVGIAVFGRLTGSVWESATQLPQWFALFVGVALVRDWLPLYIAHGQTRRQFGAQAAVTVMLFAPFLAALLALGYLLEKVLYGLAGWPQALDRAHLFSEPTQVPLVFAEHLIELAAWILAGTFIGATFYRWDGGGLLTIPVGIGMVVLADAAIGTDLRLPFIRNLGLHLPQSPAMTVGVAVGTFLLGLALTWAVIRDVPLRNKPS